MTLALASLSQSQLTIFAQCFAAFLKPGTVVCLHGPLGVGKTTFVQAVGKAFGVTETMISPTFTLMKMYPLKQGTFVHVDAYRLNPKQTHEDVLDVLQEDTYAFIEWGENLNLKDFVIIDISLRYSTALTRDINVTMDNQNALQTLKECYHAHLNT